MFTKIKYSSLNGKQQENYNFQKVAGELADYGYNCLRLNDDWQGADFLAVHVNGDDIIRVQLKGRFTIDKKYEGKNIHIAFLDGENCYVFPHDEIMIKILEMNANNPTAAWKNFTAYSWPSVPKWAKVILEEYKI